MAVALKTLFRKPVDRPIEGVIKADDESGLKTEVEEYVITGEVMKRLDTFLDSYINYENANGVWISGFFGSGKSHLLKMLSLLLEKRQIPGCDIVDEFLRKLEDNETLKGALRKAVSIPSKSILFNIDQKADIISKDQADALLAVFVKVFDETCGYYGKQPYIAHFERQLDQDGLLADFTAAFEHIQGKPWDWGRDRITRVSDAIDKAYEKVTGAKTTGVIDRFHADYKLSIEDFAEQVNKYIKMQPEKNFRLNFFVDEVGQYIAENTKLMTNLQTIAESLNTRCKGRSWVIVTAQKDMSSVVGEMEKDQANDFSKIMARFANRMTLASQDVAEVIQERLLKKEETKESLIGIIYDQQSNNFKTLFDFTDDSRTYKNYRDKDHFISCYPFVPYQFDLFQACIQNLSEQNAFEGKHQSVGERSMLGVFQDVAKHISDHELGQLATFDLMFKGIRSTLRSQVQSAINTAERNLDNKLAVRLLKVLFLVKYVREFKATVRNLSVLMLEGFKCKVAEHQKSIEEALSLLETETYIQRNGELYEFLTDEEKDVEQDIKNTEVDLAEVATEMGDFIFDGVIRQKKLHYEPAKRDFAFTRKMDDRILSREHNLAVHIVTPFGNVSGLDRHKMETMGGRELRVVMPADDRLVRDMLMYKRTAKYVAQNISVTQQESHKRILGEKGTTNISRKSDIQDMLKELLGKAKLFVNGQEVESSSEDPGTRVTAGFEKLVETVYTNLGMLQGVNYTEAHIATLLNEQKDSLITEGTLALSEAELEVLSAIQRETNKGVRMTVKSLCDMFEGNSYGWPLAAVQCILAKLCCRGKVEVKVDSKVLLDKELENALKNTKGFGNMILEPQMEFTSGQISRLKDFYKSFFDSPPKGNDATSLGKEVKAALEKLHHSLSVQASQKGTYPFLSVLDSWVVKTEQLSKKSFKHFLTDFADTAEELLDAKEDLFDPIKTFMNGSQAEIYQEARQFLTTDGANLQYVDDAAVTQIQSTLSDSNVFRGRGIQDLKTKVDDLRKKTGQKVVDERVAAIDAVTKLQERFVELPQCVALPPDRKQSLLQRIQGVLDRIGSESMIAQIRDTKRTFEERTYTELLTALEPKEPSTGGGTATTGGRTSPSYVGIRELDVPFGKPYLVSETEVEDYLAALKTAMVETVKAGHRVRI